MFGLYLNAEYFPVTHAEIEGVFDSGQPPDNNEQPTLIEWAKLRWNSLNCAWHGHG